MLAIMEQWDGKGSCHTDNTNQYLYLMLFKASLDAVVLYLCWRRLHTSFLSMCGLSIVLADVALLWSMTIVWFLGPEQSPVSTCFVLAHTSAAYAALPLPMVCLGLLDYLSEDKCLGKQGPLCKSLRNMALVLLVWVFAVVYSLGSAKNDPMEIEYLGGKTALVCEVQESPLVAYFVFGVFIAVILTLVPFWSRIPQWMRENLQHRPSLWLSITLGFVTIWMPYLSISVACLLLGLGVPAYIIVNLLWLECTNSLLVGVAFWVKSNRLGPYSHLPDDVCLWRVYWHLSKGTNQQKLPTAVFNPSQGKRKTLLHV
uniref:Uncharacterized protein n=1 Tax=Myripristis murdjan TaxID=586833 RepID=A0A667YGX2_9TELE